MVVRVVVVVELQRITINLLLLVVLEWPAKDLMVVTQRMLVLVVAAVVEQEATVQMLHQMVEMVV
jgi:hypothetical protein